MKKLYVTVSDQAYELLEKYISFFSSRIVGISKSSVVDNVLREYFQSYFSTNEEFKE